MILLGILVSILRLDGIEMYCNPLYYKTTVLTHTKMGSEGEEAGMAKVVQILDLHDSFDSALNYVLFT